MHMTGFPGVGKTEFAKSLEVGFTRVGIKCKVVILIGSIREPQDFGGFPVSTPDGVRLLPMAWARDAQRLASEGYMVVVFLDELTRHAKVASTVGDPELFASRAAEARKNSATLRDIVNGRGALVAATADKH